MTNSELLGENGGTSSAEGSCCQNFSLSYFIYFPLYSFQYWPALFGLVFWPYGFSIMIEATHQSRQALNVNQDTLPISAFLVRKFRKGKRFHFTDYFSNMICTVWPIVFYKFPAQYTTQKPIIYVYNKFMRLPLINFCCCRDSMSTQRVSLLGHYTQYYKRL